MKDFRLYVITGEALHPGRELIEVMEEAIIGGADIIQFRDKTGSREELLHKAKALRELTRKYKVPFIVNDYVDVAVEADADGIHLGQGDIPIAEARKLAPGKVIGISANTLEEALLAEAQGADYVGIGPIYATATKPDAEAPVPLSVVREIGERLTIPFVAIGGIKLSNVDEVVRAGVTRICVISEIVGSRDVAGTCREFIRRLDHR